MNEIKIFNNSTFGEIRVADVDNEPLFCLIDLCKALDLRPGDVRHRLDDGVVSTQPIKDALGRTQQANFVNEDGMYDVILDSRKPEAKAFRKWVTSEVLPSIRKRGAFATDTFIEKAIADPDFAIRMIAEMKEERIKRIAAEEKAQAQAVLLKEAEPKIQFADTFAQCKGSVLVGEMAKMLYQAGREKVYAEGSLKRMGQNTFFAWLRERHYLGSTGEYYNIPNQQYLAQGLFELKKNVHSENDILVTTTTTKVTAKGQQYFLNKAQEDYMR